MLDLTALPNFCAHEHWGSIQSMMTPEDVFLADRQQGTTPHRRTGLIDLLVDPYFGGGLAAAGTDVNALAKAAGAADMRALAADSPARAMAALRPALRPQLLTGYFQTIRRGILHLYGVDIWSPDGTSADPAAIDELDAAVAANYARLFDWYREAMGRVHFSELIRPVHPEFYARIQSKDSAAAEATFTHHIMRIDELLDLWKLDHPRRARLAEMTGVEPRFAVSWREFLGRLFDRAAAAGTTGIKQLQAYRRPLEFAPPSDSEVVWSGNLTPDQVRVFQDWVVHECCKQANDRGWPQQFHVGTHNLTQSSPMPLAALATRYPRMKLVMIHCWPFLREAGWLAKQHHNMFIDTCWMPVLNPEYYREAMTGWLNYVPASKIMCSHDSTSIEMAVGSMLFTREILGRTLAEQGANGAHGTAATGASEADLMALATDMLHNNATAVYGIGRRT
jgi:predicted TIM-barrel fold metal-dependent hydrolase